MSHWHPAPSVILNSLFTLSYHWSWPFWGIRHLKYSAPRYNFHPSSDFFIAVVSSEDNVSEQLCMSDCHVMSICLYLTAVRDNVLCI
jgi:hypothetical protein